MPDPRAAIGCSTPRCASGTSSGTSSTAAGRLGRRHRRDPHRAGTDPGLLSGCAAQQGWLRRETGETEQAYQATRARAPAHREVSPVHAMLASDAAEAGRHRRARAELDHAGGRRLRRRRGRPDGGPRPRAPRVGGDHGRGTEHAAVLRAGLLPHTGQLAVIGTGLYVLAAVDRLLGSLAALAGDHDDAEDHFSAAHNLERRVGAGPCTPARCTGGREPGCAAGIAPPHRHCSSRRERSPRNWRWSGSSPRSMRWRGRRSVGRRLRRRGDELIQHGLVRHRRWVCRRQTATRSNAFSMKGPSITGLWQQAIVARSSCWVRST